MYSQQRLKGEDSFELFVSIASFSCRIKDLKYKIFIKHKIEEVVFLFYEVRAEYFDVVRAYIFEFLRQVLFEASTMSFDNILYMIMEFSPFSLKIPL